MGLIDRPTMLDAAGNPPKRIAEYVGRLNTGSAAVSIARMESPGGWKEPGQTPEFDEYTFVLRGSVRIETHGAITDVTAGQCFFAPKGKWISGVKPAESVAFLSTFIANADLEKRDWQKPAQGALTAIAMHAGPETDRALESFVSPQQRESLRKQASFWLGAARGAEGLDLLEKMARSDPSAEVRAQVAFALFVSKQPGALGEMIRMAHGDERPRVRGQALFWLAQKAGQKAASTIVGAIENDPTSRSRRRRCSR